MDTYIFMSTTPWWGGVSGRKNRSPRGVYRYKFGYRDGMSAPQPACTGPDWDWGDRMRKIRRTIANLSQAEMAELVGVKPPTYSAWEGGRSEPGYKLALQVAYRIAAAYPEQVSVAWVLGTDDSDPLPWMDSNHQPPDWRSHNANALRGNGFGVPRTLVALPPSP